MGPNATRFFLAVLLVGLVAASVNAIRVMRHQSRASAVVAAAERHDWSETLALSENWVAGDVEGQLVAGARCEALMATERHEACFALALQVLGLDEDVSWMPSATLLKYVIQYGAERGQKEAAARVARFGRAHYPDDLSFVERVFETRIALEGEAVVLSEYEAELGPDAASLRNRVLLAAYYNRANRYEAALRVLGSPSSRARATRRARRSPRSPGPCSESRWRNDGSGSPGAGGPSRLSSTRVPASARGSSSARVSSRKAR